MFTNKKRLDEHSEFFTFRWSTLKALLDNKLVASTYIWVFVLPALMALTERFPLELPIYSFGGESPLVLNLDVPYNWYLIYFSAICFGFARLIYIARCPAFLRQYSSAAEAVANGVTVVILKDIATEYLQRFQNRTVHPLSEEGMAIDKLLSEFVGGSTHVANKFEEKNRDNFDAIIAGAHVIEGLNTGTYVIGFKEEDFRNERNHKSINLPIWRLLDLQNVSSTLARIVMTLTIFAGFIFLAIPIVQGLTSVVTRFSAS